MTDTQNKNPNADLNFDASSVDASEKVAILDESKKQRVELAISMVKS